MEITQVWSRGTGHALELANVLGRARNRLPRGEWSQVLKRLPFSKRKADMLVAIGKKFSWLNAQTFAHLPPGWSVLYQLAQLERAVFEKLLGEQVVHPKLTLREATELVAGLNRCHKKSAGINVRRRLCQFSDFVERTLSQWKPEERKLAKIELTGLIEQIDAAHREAATGHLDHPLKRDFSHRRLIVGLPAVTPKPLHQTQGRL